MSFSAAMLVAMLVDALLRVEMGIVDLSTMVVRVIDDVWIQGTAIDDFSRAAAMEKVDSSKVVVVIDLVENAVGRVAHLDVGDLDGRCHNLAVLCNQRNYHFLAVVDCWTMAFGYGR